MSGESDRVRISQVLAGALAAVTAAVLGSTMGVAGTVLGAGIASIVTTVGSALYLRSIQRTRRRVLIVRERVAARTGTTSTEHQDDRTEAEEPEPDETEDRPPTQRRRWPGLVAGAVLAFVLGMLVVTGLELVRGEPLSGGNGTTVGDLVRTDPGEHERGGAPPATEESTMTRPPTTTSRETSTEAPTGTTTPSEPTTTSTSVPPITSSVTPSGGESAPPTTTVTDTK